MNAPLNKKDFIDLESVNWLYSGAETPSLLNSAHAVQNYFESRSAGPAGRSKNAEKEASLKQNLSRMLNLEEKHIAIGANTSELMFSVVLSLNWQPGDNVVIHTLEFPSGVLPCLQLKKRGIEVRVVQHQNWEITPEQILNQVDDRTKLVISSWVSYLSGARLEYKKIYKSLKNSTTLFMVDATQALGAFKFDGTFADFVVCSSYKWLLGPHGAGILAVNPYRTEKIMPEVIGWRGISDMFAPSRFEKFTCHTDARRFETGYPSYPAIWALEASTRYLLEAGVENCSDHILKMGGYLIQHLQGLGYQVMTPADPQLRAGNISIVCPKGEKVAEALAAEKIYIWGGDNRIRASIHAFVKQMDIDSFLEALQRNFSA